MIKKTLTLKTLTVAMACTLVLVGCNRKEKEGEVELNTPPTVTPVAMNCDDASVKNNLVRTLSGELDKQVVALAASYPDAGVLELDRRARQRVAAFGVDLQQVKEAEGHCTAQLQVTLPMTDVSYANREFARANKPMLAEQAAALGITLNNNDTLVTAPISYRVVDGVVSLEGSPAVLEFLAQLATGSAYALAHDEQRVNLAGRPVPTVRPLPPTEIVRPTPIPRTDTQASTATPDSQDPLAREYQEREATNSGNNNANTSGSAGTASVPENSAPVTDRSVEITIVETDDTY